MMRHSPYHYDSTPCVEEAPLTATFSGYESACFEDAPYYEEALPLATHCFSTYGYDGTLYFDAPLMDASCSDASCYDTKSVEFVPRSKDQLLEERIEMEILRLVMPRGRIYVELYQPEHWDEISLAKQFQAWMDELLIYRNTEIKVHKVEMQPEETTEGTTSRKTTREGRPVGAGATKTAIIVVNCLSGDISCIEQWVQGYSWFFPTHLGGMFVKMDANQPRPVAQAEARDVAIRNLKTRMDRSKAKLVQGGKKSLKMTKKTQLCRNFNAGYCPYGNKCDFAHGVDDLSSPSQQATSTVSHCRPRRN